jgi:putative tryptophan/tyrosine transport system substrate-binding protein
VMERRTWLICSLGLLAAPLGAAAQPAAKAFRIGLLAGTSPTSPETALLWETFFQELRELGYVQGQNLVIESRSYGDRIERLQILADELVRLPVEVIVAGSAPAPEAAKRATSTIPIVMTNHAAAVESGLVTTLARPGGNVTGLSLASPEVRTKQLQLLKEVLPSLSRVAILSDPTNPSHALLLREAEVAARSMKMRLQIVEARAPGEFAGAFSAATKGQAGALVVLGGPMHFVNRVRLTELAAQSLLPTVYGAAEFAKVGGLMSYGVDLRDMFRRAAGYVDRILKGAKPRNLPVEQSTRFELVVNRKTAKGLGLTIPASLLWRADLIIDS